jgi:hypothetical protein
MLSTIVFSTRLRRTVEIAMGCGGCTCLSHRSAGVGLLETSETKAILKKWFDYLSFGFIILAPQEKEL